MSNIYIHTKSPQKIFLRDNLSVESTRNRLLQTYLQGTANKLSDFFCGGWPRWKHALLICGVGRICVCTSIVLVMEGVCLSVKVSRLIITPKFQIEAEIIKSVTADFHNSHYVDILYSTTFCTMQHFLTTITSVLVPNLQPGHLARNKRNEVVYMIIKCTVLSSTGHFPDQFNFIWFPLSM